MASRCEYNGKWYSNGAVVCQAGKKRKCENGAWEAIGGKCGEEEDGVVLQGPSDESGEPPKGSKG